MPEHCADRQTELLSSDLQGPGDPVPVPVGPSMNTVTVLSGWTTIQESTWVDRADQMCPSQGGQRSARCRP